MGFAASLFDESDDEVNFWRAWNSMPRGERRKFRRRLGIEAARTLKKEEVSAASVRKDLAQWVKANVLPRPTRGGGRSRSRRR
jgi:hypothetical protein